MSTINLLLVAQTCCEAAPVWVQGNYDVCFSMENTFFGSHNLFSRINQMNEETTEFSDAKIWLELEGNSVWKEVFGLRSERHHSNHSHAPL